MKYLAVKDYEHLQHYKDRAPTWIKLYASDLDDYAFLSLSEVTQRHLIMIRIAASRHDNRLPHDERYIRQAIKARGKVDLHAMISAGFLIAGEAADLAQNATDSAAESVAKPEQVASNVLAEPERNASPHVRPRTRGEGEKRREEEKQAKAGGDETAADPNCDPPGDDPATPLVKAAVAVDLGPGDPVAAEVGRVLEHYVTIHPRRKVEGKKFVSLVRRQLRLFSANELCLAIDGNAGDPWHCERKKHELAYVLRDSDVISGFIDKATPSGPALVRSASDSGMRAVAPSGSRLTSADIDWGTPPARVTNAG